MTPTTRVHSFSPSATWFGFGFGFGFGLGLGLGLGFGSGLGSGLVVLALGHLGGGALLHAHEQ